MLGREWRGDQRRLWPPCIPRCGREVPHTDNGIAKFFKVQCHRARRPRYRCPWRAIQPYFISAGGSGKLFSLWNKRRDAVVAGIFAKLNELRLANGKPVLGPVNQLIYQLNGQGFQDVVTGNNGGVGTGKGFPLLKVGTHALDGARRTSKFLGPRHGDVMIAMTLGGVRYAF